MRASRRLNRRKREIDSAHPKDRTVVIRRRQIERRRELFVMLKEERIRQAKKFIGRTKHGLEIDLSSDAEDWYSQQVWSLLMRFEFEEAERQIALFEGEFAFDFLNELSTEPRSTDGPRDSRWEQFRDNVERELRRRVSLKGTNPKSAWELVDDIKRFGIDFSDELVKIFSGVIPRRPLLFPSEQHTI